MAVSDGTSTLPAASASKKTGNLSDPYSLKRILDETANELILGRGYTEDHTLSNWKMIIGLAACAVAAAAQFYPKKFPENKPVLIACIVLYLILNALLQLVMMIKEKNHILFTHPFPGSFSSTGVAVSAKLPRYSDLYTLRIASADPRSIAAHAPVELTKSVTKWFTKDGVLAEGIFQDDVERLLDEFENEPKKSK